MQDDKPKFENQIVSKKNQKIDDEEPAKKKGKKHKKQTENVKVSRDIEDEEPEPRRKQPEREPVKKYNPQNDEKIFSDLCSVLSEYKQGTILKILQKHDFNKQDAYNQLLMMEPDNAEEYNYKEDFVSQSIKSKPKSQEKSSSSNPSENANNLMNEVFDTLLKQEINGREFEELFEEIAEMVKEDQREMGVGMIEINDLLQQCNGIKQTLIVGFREELSNFDDFQFDSSSPLYAQLQEYIQQIIAKQVKQQKQLQQDFPCLDQAPKKGKNIVDKIKQENKIKKQQEDFFTPTRSTVPMFAKERNNQASIFNVDNKYNSQKDLMSLHKEFQDVPIIDLKFIYKTLAGDYNATIDFLVKNYNCKRKPTQEIKTITYSKPAAHLKKIHSSHMREEQIDKEVQHLSYDEIREEIDHLYRLRQAFQLTKMKIKSSNQRKELDRIGNQNQPLIRKLSKASRIILVQQMAKNDPLYVDLHGYREEEISDLMDAIARMISDQANSANSKIKIRTVRGKRTACLIVMTGKGLHSRGNRSILKPAVIHWCTENRIELDQEDDHLKIYVHLD